MADPILSGGGARLCRGVVQGFSHGGGAGVADYAPRPVKVEVQDKPLTGVDAGLVAVGLFEDEELPGELGKAPGAEDARGTKGKLAMLRPERPKRVLAVGLGKRDE